MLCFTGVKLPAILFGIFLLVMFCQNFCLCEETNYFCGSRLSNMLSCVCRGKGYYEPKGRLFNSENVKLHLNLA